VVKNTFKRGFAVESVTMHTNPKTRDSRPFKNIPNFISSQLSTIVRTYTMYQPMRLFFLVGATLTVLGIVPILRFLVIFSPAMAPTICNRQC